MVARMPMSKKFLQDKIKPFNGKNWHDNVKDQFLPDQINPLNDKNKHEMSKILSCEDRLTRPETLQHGVCGVSLLWSHEARLSLHTTR